MRTLFLAQASRLADFLPSFGFVLVLARFLGPDDFGRYALSFNVAFVCSAVLPPSLTDLFGRHLTSDELDHRSVVGLGLRFRLPFAMLGIALVLIALQASAMGGPLLIAGAVAFLSLEFVGFAQATAAGMLDYEIMIRWRVIGRVTSLALAGGLVAFGMLDPFSGLVALSVGQFVTAAGTLIRIWPRLARSGAEHADRAKGLWRFGVETWLAAVLTIGLGTQKDVLLLGFLGADAGSVGVYAVAATLLTQLALLLTGGWVPASLPMLARDRGDDAKFGREWDRLVRGWALVIAPSFAALAVAATQLVPMLFGSAFSPGATSLMVFAAGYALTSVFGGGINQLALYAKDRTSEVLVARSLALATNLGLAFTLIPTFGPSGAAAATTVSILLVFVLEYVRVRARTGLRLPRRAIGMITGLTLISASVATVIGLVTGAWLLGGVIAFAGFWLSAVATAQVPMSSIRKIRREMRV